MEIKFNSDKITYEFCSEEGYYVIGFSDNDDEPNQYVILQKSIVFGEQDIELGLNTYYFEYSDQSCSGYGICKDVIVEHGKIIFIIKEKLLEDITQITIFFEKEVIQNWTEFEIILREIIDKEQLYWKL
jgi:hypothetical protein